MQQSNSFPKLLEMVISNFLIFPVIATEFTYKIKNDILDILDMVVALVDAANDKDKSVTEMVRSSLYAIGLEKPELVLSLCKDYLVKHQKVLFYVCYMYMYLVL